MSKPPSSVTGKLNESQKTFLHSLPLNKNKILILHSQLCKDTLESRSETKSKEYPDSLFKTPVISPSEKPDTNELKVKLP